MKKIVALLIAAFCCFASGCVLNIGGCGLSSFVYEYANKYTIAKEAITVEGEITDLDIGWIKSNVIVKYGEVENITFAEACDKSLTEDNYMRYWQDGKTLRIKYAKSGSFNFNDFPDKTLTVTLPQDLRLDTISCDCISAKAELADLSVEEIKLSSVSGGIKLDNINVHKAAVNTTSGNFEISKLICETSLDINTVSGTVNCSVIALDEGDYNTSVKINTVSGTVIFDSEKAPVDFSFNGVSGSLTIKLPETFNAKIKFNSVSGDFNSDMPFTTSGDIRTFGDGEGNEYSIDTVSGNCTINKIAE